MARRKPKPKSSPFHDRTVRNPQDRLRDKDKHIFIEYEYNHHGPHEADVIAINYKHQYAYVIEVKTTNHYKARKKAYSQLEHDVGYVKKRFGIDKIYKFYAYKSKRRSDREYEIKLIR